MTDSEWNAWQSTWRAAAGPLPDLRARAKRETRLHRFANIAFFLLIVVALATLVPIFSASEREVHEIGWVIVAFCAAMSIGYVWIQRGIAVDEAESPREALAFLERRLRVERFTAHLIRWVYAALCAAFLLIFPRLVAQHEKPWLEKAISYPAMALMLVVTFTAPWWVARRNRPRQQESDRWRRWMDEQQL